MSDVFLVNSLGFRITLFPAANAPVTAERLKKTGKFHVDIMPITPNG